MAQIDKTRNVLC